jgi:enoyl-CoA hydratase/carnithine racemase
VELDCIRYERRADRVAVITLDRPERLNALSGPLLDELNSAVSAAEADDEVRVLLFTGAPRPDGRPCFSAGVDVKAFAEGQGVGEEQGFALMNRIDDLLKPTLAVIDGVCSTGGVELALACDLRICGEAAQISDWHLKKLGTGLGAWGASTRWARLVGVARAKEVILTGKVLDGAEAHRIGFASELHPSEKLMDAAHETAATIAGMDPDGLKLTLAHLDRIEDMSRDQALRWAQLAPQWLGVRVEAGDIRAKILDGSSSEDSD